MGSLRLKTKLMLAITGMVVAIVSTLSTIYISQLIKQRIDETFQSAEFVSLEVYDATRNALIADLDPNAIDLNNPKVVNKAIAESLRSDKALNSLLQSSIAYAPTLYDIAITDPDGKAIIHTDGSLTGKLLPARDDLAVIKSGGFLQQVDALFGGPRVYEVRLPLKLGTRVFATVRVGVSMVLLKGTLQPKLNSALFLSGIAILLSLLVAAVLSHLALRPLEEIGRKLDEMSAAAELPQSTYGLNQPQVRKDEYGVVSTKIHRLGQQMRDVKEVFSALQENLNQIMANLQDGVMLFTRDDKAVMVSSSVETFLHKNRAELLGRSAGDIFSSETELGRLLLDAFNRHQPIGQTELTNHATGIGYSPQRVQVSLDFIEERGVRFGALLTLRDAESVHRIEDELEVSRRLASLGRLTSGVAHEVKNPINAIVVHLELLRQKMDGLDPNAKRHVDVIGSEIRRLDRVVQTLVDFTRPMELRLVELDLRRLLDDVLTLSSPDAEQHGVMIQRNISAEPLPVKVDADLVKQALLNVILNGVQSMADGGTLTVTAARNNGDVLIEIADQGGGIPAEIHEKIFNLYFTTKKGGSGIGLPMAYRVMQLHNGAMEFDSVDGKGTTFHMRFPIVESTSLGASSRMETVGESSGDRKF